jgi:hypothetical protein
MLILGIGSKTKGLVSYFKKHKQYVIEDHKGYTAEQYEKNFEKEAFKEKVRSFDEEDVLLIAHSSEPPSGQILVALEVLKDYDVDVLLLKDDISNKPKSNKLLDRMIYGVLQQKAGRAFMNLILVDMGIVDGIISPNVTITAYKNAMNTFIGTAVDWHYYARFSDPQVDAYNMKSETTNILTYGMFNLDTGEETLFFDIKHPREKEYHLFLNDEKMNEPGLLKKVKEKFVDKNCDVGFGIYDLEGDSFAQCVVYTSYTWDAQEID